MLVLNDLIKINLPTVVALGNFDSMHLGHQELIKRSVDLAKELGCLSVVFTFKKLPINVITGHNVVKNVLTPEIKFSAIEKLGVDILINADFNHEMQGMSPKDFVEVILKDTLNCSVAVCGYNYSFGYMGHGNPEILSMLTMRAGFDTMVMDEYKINDMTVSSTLIRKLLEDGNVDSYEMYTGRKYILSGTVIEGQHLGTRMGFPTVNLNLSTDTVVPHNGVYVTNIYIDGTKYKSVTNIGNKPTVGEFGKNAETHVFGFDGNLYGKDVTIEFIHFLRPEFKFDSIEELEAQIAKDCEEAEKYIC